MTTRDLQEAERAYQAAQSRADTARLERNAVVRAALVAGWSQAQIAAATGLSRGRVGQLAQGVGRRVFVAHEAAS